MSTLSKDEKLVFTMTNFPFGTRHPDHRVDKWSCAEQDALTEEPMGGKHKH